MSWFKRFFKPSSIWENIASEIGGEYSPGDHASPLKFHDEKFPIHASVQLAGMDEGGPSKYTQLIAYPPLLPKSRIAVIHKWPGQKLWQAVFTRGSLSVEAPVLGSDYLVLAESQDFSDRILGTESVLHSIRQLGIPFKVTVGGIEANRESAIRDEIVICSPGVISNPEDLLSLANLGRAFLSALDTNQSFRT